MLRFPGFQKIRPAILAFPLSLALCLPSPPVFAQNQIPNGQFEQHSLCPTGYNQALYLDDWTVGSGSPDYFNCGYYGTAAQAVPALGTGVMGFWGGSNHPACPGGGYAEHIEVALTTPLVAGESYTLSFRMQVDGAGSVSAAPNDCMDFGFYFYHAADPAPLSLSALCCPSIEPQVRLSGSSLQQGSYTLFDYLYTAPEGFDKMLAGTFCNALTSTAGCANYAANRLYFNLDEVSLEAASVLRQEIPSPDPDKDSSTATIGALYPNPTRYTTTLPLSLAAASQVIIQISDLSGREISRQKQAFPAGQQALKLDTSGLAAGVYLLRTSVYQSGGASSRVEKLSVM